MKVEPHMVLMRHSILNEEIMRSSAKIKELEEQGWEVVINPWIYK